jgi:hypothetical protein
LLDLVVTELGQYPKLLCQIREHHRFLGRGRVVGLLEADAAGRAAPAVPSWLVPGGRH